MATAFLQKTPEIRWLEMPLFACGAINFRPTATT